jgi:ABC-type multidrug transport system fused ATPase/permease subunit
MTALSDPVTATPRGVVRHYWRVVGGRWWQIAIPVGLITVANALEGLSLALIIPLTKAFSDNSFAFMDDSWALSWMPNTVPDSITDPALRDAWLLGLVFGLLILGRVGKVVFEYASTLYSVERLERYRVLIGQETFGRVLGFGRQYFDRQALGRIDTEISWSSSLLSLLEDAEALFRSAMALVVKGAVMLVMSVPLLLTFAVVVPIVQWAVTSINKAVKRISHEGLEVERQARSQMIDILGSIPLVKAYSQEESTSDQYGLALRRLEDVAVRKYRILGLRNPVEEVAILVSMLLAQGVLIYAAGEFSLAQIAIFAGFLVVLQQSLHDYKVISRCSLSVMEQLPKLEALAALFTDDAKFIVSAGDRPFEKLAKGITIQQLSFCYYDGTQTLDGVEAVIPAGKVTAIVGPSGAGKTTLLELLTRQYDCPAGTIFLDGTDIREYALPTLHERMALVSQRVWLLNRSLRDNLTFGLPRTASDEELNAVLADVELRDMVQGLSAGLDTEIGDHGVRLSGGQRQRVAIARTLLRNPELLILDEATSALDSEVEYRVARAIQRRVAGHTLIVVAHRLSTIRDADQILVLEDGALVERGNWDELVASGGTFSRLHAAQFKGDDSADPA